MATKSINEEKQVAQLDIIILRCLDCKVLSDRLHFFIFLKQLIKNKSSCFVPEISLIVKSLTWRVKKKIF